MMSPDFMKLLRVVFAAVSTTCLIIVGFLEIIAGRMG